MSEEKMRAAFRKLFKYEMSDDAESETFARGYQAALQESEAGAVYLLCVDNHQGLFEFVMPEHVADLASHGISVDKYYLAPPSAPTIETAAYMRAAEVCERLLTELKLIAGRERHRGSLTLSLEDLCELESLIYEIEVSK